MLQDLCIGVMVSGAAHTMSIFPMERMLVTFATHHLRSSAGQAGCFRVRRVSRQVGSELWLGQAMCRTDSKPSFRGSASELFLRRRQAWKDPGFDPRGRQNSRVGSTPGRSAFWVMPPLSSTRTNEERLRALSVR